MALLLAVSSFHSPDDNDLGRGTARPEPGMALSKSASADTCPACRLEGLAATGKAPTRPLLSLRVAAISARPAPASPDLEAPETSGSRAPPSV
jgi:hypothetical protein